MRPIFRTLLLLISLGLIYTFVFLPSRTFFQNALRNQGSGLAAYQDALGFVLNDTKPLTFSLPAQTRQVRFLVTPCLASEKVRTFGEGFLFPIQYRVESPGRDPIEGQWSFRARLTTFIGPNGESLYRNRFETEQLQPLDLGEGKLGLPENLPSSRISFWLKQPGPLNDVVLRVYVPTAKTTDAYADWVRLSQNGRSALAEASILDHHFLEEEEKAALLASQWEPQAPLGVTGEDYLVRHLYSLSGPLVRADEGQKQLDTAYLAAPYRDFIFAIQPGPITWQFQTQTPDLSTGVHLTYRTESNISESKFELPPGVQTGIWNAVPQAGLLQVSPTFSGTFNANQNGLPLENIGTVRPFWTMEPSHNLNFQLMQTTLSQALRITWTSTTEAPIDPIQYALLGPQREIIDQGTLRANEQISRLLYLEDQPDEKLRTLSTAYLELPPNAVELILSASQPIWANVFNRPSQKAYKIRVPEQYMDEEQRPGWFLLEPANPDSPPVRIVDAKPLESPLPQPETEVEIFEPTPTQPARFFWDPRVTEAWFSDDSAATAFVPVDPGTVSLNILSQGGPLSNLQVLIINPSASQKTLDLRWGDQNLRFPIPAPTNLFDLPPSQPGPQLFNWQPIPNAQLLISGIHPGPHYWRKMMAYSLARRQKFNVQKPTQAEMRFSVRAFLPQSADRCQITVSLEPAPQRTVAQGYTYSKRIFDVAPGQEHATCWPVRDPLEYASSQSFYFKLDSDLPPGDYTLELSSSDPQVHVRLAALAPAGTPQWTLKKND